MAVGLSSNFLEPMEATSIHSTIMQLEIFTTIYLGIDSYETIFETNINKYNLAFSKIFDSYRDLIQIHYITKREDSDFWKWVNNEMPKTDKVKEIIEICKYKCPSPFDFDNIIGAAGWGTWSNVVSGLGILQKRIACNTLWGNDLHNDSEQNFDKMMHHYYKHTKNFITHNEFIKFIKTEKNK
jgi:tryptophan halogenase